MLSVQFRKFKLNDIEDFELDSNLTKKETK